MTEHAQSPARSWWYLPEWILLLVSILLTLGLIFDLIETLPALVIWAVFIAVDIGMWLGRRDPRKAQ